MFQNGEVLLNYDQLRNATMDDEQLMREILSAVVEDMSVQIESLANAIGRQDAEDCKRLAHYSKGACANVGAESVAGLLREIEKLADQRDFEACDRSLKALSVEIAKLRSLT